MMKYLISFIGLFVVISHLSGCSGESRSDQQTQQAINEFVSGRIVGANGTVKIKNTVSNENVSVDENGQFAFGTPKIGQPYILQISEHPQDQCCYFTSGDAQGVQSEEIVTIEITCSQPTWSSPENEQQTFLPSDFNFDHTKPFIIKSNTLGDRIIGWHSSDFSNSHTLQLFSEYQKNTGKWEHPLAPEITDIHNFILPHPSGTFGSINDMSINDRKNLTVFRKQSINESSVTYPFIERRLDLTWNKSASFSDLVDNIPVQSTVITKQDINGNFVAIWKNSGEDQEIKVFIARPLESSVMHTIPSIELNATRGAMELALDDHGNGLIMWAERRSNQDQYLMHAEISNFELSFNPTSYNQSLFPSKNYFSGYSNIEIDMVNDNALTTFTFYDDYELYPDCPGEVNKRFKAERINGQWNVPATLDDYITLDYDGNPDPCGNSPSATVKLFPSGDGLLVWLQQDDTIHERLMYQKKADGQWSPTEILLDPYVSDSHGGSSEADASYQLSANDQGDWILVYSHASTTSIWDTTPRYVVDSLMFKRSDQILIEEELAAFETQGGIDQDFSYVNYVKLFKDGNATAVFSIPEQGQNRLFIAQKNESQWVKPNDYDQALSTPGNPNPVFFKSASFSSACNDGIVVWSQEDSDEQLKLYASQKR